jgi:hypothetical protein
VWLNISGVISEPRYYKHSDTPNYFVGYWTAICHLDGGRLTAITWDDGCGECSNSECINEESCGIAYSDINDCLDDKLCNFTVRSFVTLSNISGLFGVDRNRQSRK